MHRTNWLSWIWQTRWQSITVHPPGRPARSRRVHVLLNWDICSRLDQLSTARCRNKLCTALVYRHQWVLHIYLWSAHETMRPPPEEQYWARCRMSNSIFMRQCCHPSERSSLFFKSRIHLSAWWFVLTIIRLPSMWGPIIVLLTPLPDILRGWCRTVAPRDLECGTSIRLVSGLGHSFLVIRYSRLFCRRHQSQKLNCLLVLWQLNRMVSSIFPSLHWLHDCQFFSVYLKMFWLLFFQLSV